MNNNEQVLLESPAARNAQLAQIGTDRAEELLTQAKALHFNVCQGTGIATTEQVAEFYEVPLDTVKSAVKYHRSEFDADGLKVLTGKELSSVRLKFNLTNKTRNLTIWNPRSTLRLGYLLRDSEIAKAVRTTSLNFIEQATQPTQVPPKTTAQMLVVWAQQMVEQERRIQSVEAKVEQIEQRSSDAAQALYLLPAPTETAPPLTERDSLRKLINAWCQSNNIPHQEAWGTLYNELYLRDGFSVNARRKNSKYATNLELVAESGKLGVLYAIATEIFPHTVIG
jgi:hypothetical protein